MTGQIRIAALVALIAASSCNSSHHRTASQTTTPIPPTRIETTATSRPPPAAPAPAPDVRGARLSFVDSRRGWSAVQVCVAASCQAMLEATNDGGATWRTAGSGFPPAFTGLHFANERDGYAWAEPHESGNSSPFPPAPPSKLYLTRDGGANWQPTAITEPVAALTTGATEDWALVGDCPTGGGPCAFRLMVTADRGTTWTERPLRVSGFVPSVLRAGANAWVYGSPGEGAAAQLWFSGDGGRHWSAQPAPDQCDGFYPPRLTAASTGALWLACAGQPGMGNQGKGVFRSADGGRHWRPVSLTEIGEGSTIGNIPAYGYLQQFAAATDSSAWMALNRGTLLATHDRGVTWSIAPGFPLSELFFSDMQVLDTRHVWVSALDTAYPESGRAALYRTTDGGHSWLRSSLAIPR